jgi:predicted RNA binding protein YcfA (HicA-like mRNA interferase family)
VTVYSFNDFRKVLKKAGFSLVRRKKHETWQKVLSDGTVLQVRISFKFHQDIYPALFSKMLKQAGLSKQEFESYLKE